MTIVNRISDWLRDHVLIHVVTFLDEAVRLGVRTVDAVELELKRRAARFAGDGTREILERLNASHGKLQTVPLQHIRIQVEAPSHKTRIFHVSRAGVETEISDCIRAVHFHAQVGELATATLECYAGIAGGDYLLAPRKAIDGSQSNTN